MDKIQLTEEQRKCAEYPLSQKLLVINADPGTGKTEVLKQRVIFIHNYLTETQPENQPTKQLPRKLILVLAYGKNIAKEIRAKLSARGLKVYHRLKYVQPLVDHQHICTSLDNDCPTRLENRKPLILVCTIHSLASGINDLVIKRQFQEERKIHVLTTTQRVDKKQGLVSHQEQNQKFS
jgi:superfamily I DNA/RNA helicase